MSLSIPQRLIASLDGQPGFYKASFIQAHENQGPNTSIRLNPNKIGSWNGQLPPGATGIPWSPDGYYLADRPSFTHDPLFHGGLYYVQEPGSQFLWEVFRQFTNPQEPLRVLDLCAAPGGKSTLAASFFKNGLIVSNEIMKNRAAVLSENATKWGTGNIIVTNNEPSHFQRLKGYFDVVVVDAPCSGSGLFRKDPVAVEQWSEQLVDSCSGRQQRILKDVLPALKQGGLLVYSTCSYSVEEDEQIMDYLITNGLQALALTDHEKVSKGVAVVNGKLVDAQGNPATGYKFYPDQVRSEGFFISAFLKTGEQWPGFGAGTPVTAVSQKEKAVVQDWLRDDLDLLLFKQGEQILALENKWAADLAILQKNLFLKKAGVSTGQIKGKGLVPAHDLALSCWVSQQAVKVPRWALDRAQSLQYLKCQPPDILTEAGTIGWHLAQYEGIALGWMKVLAGRVNNYYPRNWRILKD